MGRMGNPQPGTADPVATNPGMVLERAETAKELMQTYWCLALGPVLFIYMILLERPGMNKKTRNLAQTGNYFTSKFPTLKELVFTREKRFGAKRILY